VPFSEEDKEAMSLKTDPGLFILGFVKMSEVYRLNTETLFQLHLQV
jgi:hypothetical protein